jgi:trk system potassium uptake protein TrkH
VKPRSRWAKAFTGAGPVLQATGLVLVSAGVLTLTPLLLLFFMPVQSGQAAAFLLPGGLLAGAGLLLIVARPRNGTRHLDLAGGSLVVALAWAAVCAVSALPVRRLSGLPYLQSVFEAVSGWTTTGLSVVDVASAPRILLLWRSIMQLAGGAGLAIIMLAVTSLPVGAGLYRAEGRSDQLVPHVVRSAKLVVLLYAAYAAVGTVAYVLAGMSVFDAVNHSFCAVSTGGFSTHSESIGYWDSPAVEAVTLPLMILGNLNFLTAYVLFRGRLRRFLANGEVQVMMVSLPAAVLVLFLLVTARAYPSLAKGARVAIFEAVSALTTTGYSTVSYASWPPVGAYVLILLMLIGGGTCSTAGGIKQFRVYLLTRALLREIRQALLPRGAVTVIRTVQGEREVFVDEAQIRQAGLFLFLYLSTFFLGVGIMTACGIELKDALFEFASTVGTVGLSVGVTSANLPAPVLIAQIAGMLLGRLEFFVLFVAAGRALRGAGFLLAG